MFENPLLRKLAIGLLGVLVLALLAAGAHSLMKGGKGKKPRATVVAVLRPPPPPPPPKPELKPPPPPEMKKEEVKLDEPKPDEPKPADQPPVSQDLKMDGPAGAGDGFGISAGKGRDITTIGGGGTGGTGTGRGTYAFFTNVLQQQLQDELMQNRKLRSVDYKAVVRLWLNDAGRVTKVEVASSTGNAEIDQTIRTVIAESSGARQGPPPDMPQPVKIEVTSRGAG